MKHLQRLVVFAHSIDIAGGAPRSLLELLLRFSRETTDILVVVPHRGQFTVVCEQSNIEILALDEMMPEIPFCGLWWIESGNIYENVVSEPNHLPAAVKRLVEAIGDSVDLVYTNTSTTPLGAFFAAAISRPHVWHIREFGDDYLQWSYALGKSTTYEIVQLLSTLVLVPSSALRDHLKTICPRLEALCIPNGPLDSTWQQAVDRAPPTDSFTRLVLVGSVTRHKGQDQAIAALVELVRRTHRCRLDFYGTADQTFLNELKLQAKRSRVEHLIQWNGATAQPREAFLSADIALVCSRCEAFGRVTAEAMSTGMPVVAADTGATGEIIDDGQTGLLYRYGDAKSLADQVEALLVDPTLSQSIALQGRETALSRYRADDYAARVWAALNEAFVDHDPDSEQTPVSPEVAGVLLAMAGLCIHQNVAEVNRNHSGLAHAASKFLRRLAGWISVRTVHTLRRTRNNSAT